MATTTTNTPRKRTTKTTTGSRTRSTQQRAASTAADDSLVARAGRMTRDRLPANGSIAVGAVTIVAAAAAGAAGAFLYARRDKGFKEASEELTSRVKGGFASAGETVRDGIASATDTVKDLGQRGTAFFKGDGSETRSQQQIAEEALKLKQTGAANNPVNELSATEVNTGAVAH